MRHSLRRLILVLAALAAAPARAEIPQPGASLADFDELTRLADVAQARTDPRITANAREEPTVGRDGTRNIHAHTLTLVSVEGLPAFVVHRRNFGNHGWQPAFTARCAGQGRIEVTALLFDGGYSWDRLRSELGENPALSLQLAHANTRTPLVVPATLERAFPDSRFFGRYRATVRADDPFWDRMAGAPYLWAQLMAGQRRLTPVGGSDLSNFDATMRALVQQCRGIRPATPTERAVGEFRERFLDGPNAEAMRTAIQRHIDSGGAVARATGLRVVRVERFECHGVSEGRFLCRYKPEIMGDTSNPVIRFGLAFGDFAAPSWALFAPDGQGWRFAAGYADCWPKGDGGFTCSARR